MKNEFTVQTTKKSWHENFSLDWKELGVNLLDFWRWSASDLLNNSMRWKLAEFIVAHALSIDFWYRVEWDDFDLEFHWLKIELKSWAYIQSWEQHEYSKIIFTIRPTKSLNTHDIKRRADIYIFALLKTKDAKVIDSLKLEQWDFYIVRTSEINDKLLNQKSLSLRTLLTLSFMKSSYSDLRDSVSKFIDSTEGAL
jgi:hypothetical protein